MDEPTDQERQTLLSAELAAAADLMREHADDPDSRACPVCWVPRCQIWRDADAAVLRGLMQVGAAGSDEADQGQEER